jgi:hypothetical protein
MLSSHARNPRARRTGVSAFGFPDRSTEAEVIQRQPKNQRYQLRGPFWITARIGRRTYLVPTWRLRPIPASCAP